MIDERIKKLRSLMKQKNIDAYIVPTSDFHGSEYVGEYFKCREYITGFTGSAGTAVITATKALLWTDGRYFIQAATELKGTCIELMKSGEEGTPTIEKYLCDALKSGQTLGFDGRCVDYVYAKNLEDKLMKNDVNISYEYDLVGEIWDNRPEMSKEKVMLLDTKYCGQSREDKILNIRKEMALKNADIYILTSLDDIAWAFNIRGNDIRCNPVVLSYCIITSDDAVIYASGEAFTDDIASKFEKANIKIRSYNDIYEDIKKIPIEKIVYIDGNKANYAIVKNIREGVKVINEQNLTLLPKAIKNNTEIENMRKAHIKDGVAVTKFMYWLKKNVGRIDITEISAAKYLECLREQNENYMGPSFEPIVAYGANAAMCHYAATSDSDTKLIPKGLVLFDTGGQYLEGTTDITRTVALGECTLEEKRHYTAVLRGHLALAAAHFPYGVRGANLDILARGPLWDMGLNYNHGTGHGVGYFLNVHEGPNNFNFRIVNGKMNSVVLEEGMITSNEPGYYEEGSHGIRTENLIVCLKSEKTEYGQFMKFENLTMVPIDIEAIDMVYMTDIDKMRLNAYHREVYDKISPYLSDEEREWLKEATKEV